MIYLNSFGFILYIGKSERLLDFARVNRTYIVINFKFDVMDVIIFIFVTS